MLGELNDQEIDLILRKQRVGRIGCHAEGVTYVVPVGYAYDGAAVYGLSAEGMKLRMMRANPRVCFEVEQVEHWANWQSVIAWGSFEELTGSDAENARALLHSVLTPLMEFESKMSASPRTRRRQASRGVTSSLFRIRLDERTGDTRGSLRGALSCRRADCGSIPIPHEGPIAPRVWGSTRLRPVCVLADKLARSNIGLVTRSPSPLHD